MPLQRDPEETETKFLHDLFLCSNLRVLEIGCGDGRLTWRYAQKAGQVVGIDIDHASLQKARQERPADLASKVTFALASAESLPFPPEGFDAAVLAWSLAGNSSAALTWPVAMAIVVVDVLAALATAWIGAAPVLWLISRQPPGVSLRDRPWLVS